MADFSSASCSVKKPICQHPRFPLLSSVQNVTEHCSSQQQKRFKLYFNFDIQYYHLKNSLFIFFFINCPKTKETVMICCLAQFFTKGSSSWWGLPSAMSTTKLIGIILEGLREIKGWFTYMKTKNNNNKKGINKIKNVGLVCLLHGYFSSHRIKY